MTGVNKPMAPNTQGALLGFIPKHAHKKFNFKGKNKNSNNNSYKQREEPAATRSWAQTASLNIPRDIMQEKDNTKYVEHLMVRNNIQPNHVITPEVPKKPKVAADMEMV